MVKPNTPSDAPQVPGNCGLSLNRDESLSVADSKTCFNTPEVDLPAHTQGLKAKTYVFVRSITGEPLMPCTPAKARKLIKTKRATVVKNYPFVIQLTFECENQVQDVHLGIDTGYGNIGFSAITTKKELYCGTLILDNRTAIRLIKRKNYRMLKRRKLRNRKKRFLNKKKKQGWLPPSIQRRYNTHLRLIIKIKQVLPVTNLTVEIAKFDIQKIEEPQITKQGRSEGDMYEYQNMRSFLMVREKGLCQLCKKEFTQGNPSHIHHCKERKNQGSNRAKNLVLIHKKCHETLHEKGLKLNSSKEYKQSIFMSIVNRKFKQDIKNASITYGYITFVNRNKLGLEKTHYNDAFIIAKGTLQQRANPIIINQKHKNNRSLGHHIKGRAAVSRTRRYKIQPRDLIWMNKKKNISTGSEDYGTRVGIQNDKKDYSIKKVQKIYHSGTFAYN